MPQQTDTETDFAALLEPYRRELQVHCYRMTGSYDASEDLVQETFPKAWRSREAYEGRASLRTWLYRIATNTCLDHLRRHRRAPHTYERLPGMEHGEGEPPTYIEWLQPYPDELVAGIPAEEAGPESQALSRETVELVFLAALQHLPPRQRAVLILRDVVGLPAAETAGRPVHRVRQQRPAARPSGTARAPAGGPPYGMGPVRGADPGGARGRRALPGRGRAARSGRDGGAAGRRRQAHHAAEPVLVRRPRGDHRFHLPEPGPGRSAVLRSVAAPADLGERAAGGGGVTSSGRGRPSTAPSPWKSCVSRTAGSRRSPPSSRICCRSSGCR